MSLILFVIGGGLLTTFLTGQTSYLSGDAYVRVQEEARKAFDNVVRELREAGWETTVPKPSPGLLYVGGGSGTSSQLEFQVALGYNLPSGGCELAPYAGAICWGAQDGSGANRAGWSVRYEVAGKQLLRKVFDAAGAEQTALQRVLANDVDAPNSSFAWDAAASVRTVTITLQILYQNSALPGGSQTTNQLTSRVRLRNS